MKKPLFVLMMLAVSAAAHAHYVWLERDATGPVRAYFGEWENDKIEKSGAALDRIASPLAFAGDARQALKIDRRADHLEIQASSAEDVVLVESGLAPREDKQAGGKTKTVFYAKNGRSSTQAKLDLDFVPAAANANQFTLMLRGAPLAKTEIKVYGPPKWEKSFKTDDKGQVTIATPWAGRYVMEVIHIEPTPGEAAGEKYDRLRHVSTLSFLVKEGIAWPAGR
jgi:uncharacterized GH25 family protein